jgi:large subunit ribosomal protein L31e
MAEKKEVTKNIEREYVIPLRNKCMTVVRYKKAPKAVKVVKEFIAKHMKVEDRDLTKVRLDKYVNEALWFRGIKKPIHKIKVKAVKDESGIVRVYAVDLPTNLHYKKLREEKASEAQKKIGEKAKKEIEAQKKAAEEAEAKEVEKAEEATGVPEEVAKEEAKLDVKETKKAKTASDEKEKESVAKASEQKELKKEAKENAEAPKKGKEKIAELRKEDKTSRGH